MEKSVDQDSCSQLRSSDLSGRGKTDAVVEEEVEASSNTIYVTGSSRVYGKWDLLRNTSASDTTGVIKV